MTNAYCTIEDVKTALSGADASNSGSSRDKQIADKILEISRDVDGRIAKARGASDASFSLLADRLFSQQVITLSSTPPATYGSLSLEFKNAYSAPIAVGADSATVQVALLALATVDEDGLVVSGPLGGPWTVDFAGTMTGPQPAITGYNIDMTPMDARITVLSTIQGVLEVPSERLFTSVPDLYGMLLPIDVCREIIDVNVYDPQGNVQKNFQPIVDYRAWPLSGLPIQALKSTQPLPYALVGLRRDTIYWPVWPYTIGVRARWGWADQIPYDAREAVVIEVVRGVLGGQVGFDDRVGMTPYGSTITTKSFTSKFRELIDTYGQGLW
jgi:hypothetical protein